MRDYRAWWLTTGDTLDTTHPYNSTPGDNIFKRQIVITGVCFLPCYIYGIHYEGDRARARKQINTPKKKSNKEQRKEEKKKKNKKKEKKKTKDKKGDKTKERQKGDKTKERHNRR